MTAAASSIDPADVARFSAIAAQWWDPNGKFGPLHRLNPARLAFIREQAVERFGRDAKARSPFSGLRLLDIGCGGGLLTEPMTRLGFSVTGIDPSEGVEVARAHAVQSGLAIDYRPSTVEDLITAGEAPFDMILNMEVVEHVADPGQFLRDGAGLLAPGGLMVVATLNRTLKALALGKVAAEYLLRWVPAGTHDWRKFLKPDEIRAFLDGEGLEVHGPFGLVLDPISGRWRQSADAEINYMMTVGRSG